MASVVKAEILSSLQSTKLGKGPGEAGLQEPFNTRNAGVNVRVTNHSDTVKRRTVKTYVSHRRGAAAVNKKYNMTPEWVREEVLQGRDMNEYEYVIKPIKARLMHDGKVYEIKPGETKAVPEGMWDLYLGNFDRVHSQDASERLAEGMHVAQRFAGRDNPAMRKDPATGEWATDDAGEVIGYLEFIREEVQPQSLADAELLRAGDIEEV